MGSHASPDLWISAEKNPRSAELRRTFCDVEFRRKKIFSAEILGKSIESAEVHYTKPEDEFRRTIGLNTKFRREKHFSAQVRYTISVVEFRRKTKNQVRKNNCNRFGGTGSQFYLNFPPKKKISRSQTPPCPIIGRNGKKVHKARRDLFGKLI